MKLMIFCIKILQKNGMMAFSNMPVNIECILVYVLLIALLFDFLKLFNKKCAQFYVRTFTLKIKYASLYIRTFALKTFDNESK